MKPLAADPEDKVKWTLIFKTGLLKLRHQLPTDEYHFWSRYIHGGAMHEPEESNEDQFDVQPSPNPE